MRSISLPGLVLWLPLGSPAASLKHTQPVALNRKTKTPTRFPFFGAFRLLASSDTAWLKDFPECTTLRSHCRRRRLQRSILKPRPSSFFVPHSQPYASRHPPPPPLLSNAPASGIRGPQVTPPTHLHLVLLWQVHCFFITSAPFYYTTATLHLIPTQE